MSWFKLDDQFPNHPKVRKAGTDAAWLFVAGGCYCAQYLTDGMIPKEVVASLTSLGRPKVAAAALVGVGLWIDRGTEYEVHDYLAYNPTREKVLSEREAASNRRKKGARRSADVRATDGGRSDAPSPSPTFSNENEGDDGPDPMIATLVAGYVDDYRVDREGHDPPQEWRAAAGAAAKRALRNSESADDVSRCLGVIARESKHPNTLPYVLADMHAGRARRA